MKKASVRFVTSLFFLMVSLLNYHPCYSSTSNIDCDPSVIGSILYPDNDPTQKYIITGPTLGTAIKDCYTNGINGRIDAVSAGTKVQQYHLVSVREDGYCSKYEYHVFPAQKYYGPDDINCPPPEDCTDEWNALVDSCGGADKVATWVDEPLNDPPVCAGSCMCPGQDMNTAAADCEDSGGWILDYNSYDESTCEPVCNDCREDYASGLTNCENGRWYWDNESCSEVCKDCDTAQADCSAGCESNGTTVAYFSCEMQSALISQCVCTDDGDGGDEPEPEPEPEPDPGDDPTDPDDDPADDPPPDDQPVDDPDTEPPPADPEPDPVDDPDDGANGWLKEIKHNTDTLVTQNNSIISDLNTVGNNTASTVRALNDANDKLDNIAENSYATAGNTSKILDELGDIESAIENFDFEDIRTTGNAGQPGAVQYNTDLATVEESSLIDSVSTYISNGLPIISYLNGSYVDISGASPVMSANVWGYQIDFDISPMQDILDAMGIILVGVCSIVAFFIVIGRW